MASAQTEDDPFALLFPEAGRLDVSQDARAGNSNLQLVSLSLRGRPLLDTTPAFTSPDGLCLPFQRIADALRFPIQFEDGTDVASGWFITKNRTLRIDFQTREILFNGRPSPLADGAVLATNVGWCLSLNALSDLFPIDFDYNERTLSISARPREILPVEARLEREARRRDLSGPSAIGRASYRPVGNPYRWISIPVADIMLDARVSSGGFTVGRYSGEAAGDFLKSTTRFGIQGSFNEGIDQVRLNLSRSNDKKTELGPLKARRFAIGDVAAPSLPLLTDLQTGRGVQVSNLRQGGADLFNSTKIRGPLPQGWEAELHDGEQLLAFTQEPDAQGNYVFDNVILQPGLNIFEVRLFGPFGETETREVKYFISSELNPENEITYAFGVVEPNKSVLGADQVERGSESETSNFGESLFTQFRPRDATGPILYSTLEKGINERLSVRLDAVSEFGDRVAKDVGVAASAFFSIGGTFGALRLASDGSGIPALEASLQRRFVQGTSLRARIAEFGDLENSFTGRDAARINREGDITANSSLLLGRRTVPVQATIGWQNLASGLRRFRAASRVATTVARTSLSHTIRFIRTADVETNSNIANGEWLASRNVGAVRVRGGLSYDVAPTARLRTLSLTGQSNLRGGIAQFGLRHDIVGQDVEAVAAWSRPIGPAMLSTSAGWRQSGSWNVGINLAFSLFKPKDRLRPAIGPPGLSRAGSVRLTAFQDIDGDRAFGTGDVPVPGVQFIVQDSLRAEASGTNGSVVLGGIATNRPSNIELRTSSLEDPFLSPVELGRTISVRPGQVIDIPFPLQATGDVEGTVQVQNGEFLVSVSGVKVQAIDVFGEVAGETRTEFDGYIYIADLPVGRYTLRIAPEDLARVNGMAVPAPFELTDDAPSAFGIDMTIEIAAAS
ncbi:MAG: carboxypeptidase-like regulatory domain-containing protein [Pseudomonadota bacterium]